MPPPSPSQELEKGRYASTDTYVAHAICRPDRRLVFLLTDRRVLLLTRNEIFGSWQVRHRRMLALNVKPKTLVSSYVDLHPVKLSLRTASNMHTKMNVDRHWSQGQFSSLVNHAFSLCCTTEHVS